MRFVFTFLLIIYLFTISSAALKKPDKIKDVMRQIIISQDVLKLIEIVSPIYGLAINRIEFGVSSDEKYVPKYRFLNMYKGDPYKGITGYIGEVLLTTKDIKAIASKIQSKAPTKDYSIEELGIIENLLGWFNWYGDPILFNKPIYQVESKASEFFVNNSKPQLIKQKQIMSGNKSFTIDQKEDFYEFGYLRLKDGGAPSFHFHTDKNGNLWLWAIQ